jgi:hypothetical protein
MLLIRHYVGVSGVAGAGLFCSEALPRGTRIYEYDPRFLIEISQAELARLPEAMREAVLRYSFRGRGAKRLTGSVWYCADDSRFMNHADPPSTVWDEAAQAYLASADLPAHSELTCHYLDFCEPEDLDFVLDSDLQGMHRQSGPPGSVGRPISSCDDDETSTMT